MQWSGREDERAETSKLRRTGRDNSCVFYHSSRLKWLETGLEFRATLRDLEARFLKSRCSMHTAEVILFFLKHHRRSTAGLQRKTERTEEAGIRKAKTTTSTPSNSSPRSALRL